MGQHEICMRISMTYRLPPCTRRSGRPLVFGSHALQELHLFEEYTWRQLRQTAWRWISSGHNPAKCQHHSDWLCCCMCSEGLSHEMALGRQFPLGPTRRKTLEFLVPVSKKLIFSPFRWWRLAILSGCIFSVGQDYSNQLASPIGVAKNCTTSKFPARKDQIVRSFNCKQHFWIRCNISWTWGRLYYYDREKRRLCSRTEVWGDVSTTSLWLRHARICLLEHQERMFFFEN